MELATIHDVSIAINLVHRFVYFVPETAEEYGALGATGSTGYFASRSAPLGPVPPEVVLATFYNFSPRAVHAGMADAWQVAAPEQWQAARFRVVARALERVGNPMTADEVAEARAIVDPVVAKLCLAGTALAAANAAVALPDDRALALWQQLAVLREWRGDLHIAALLAGGIGPSDCLVLQVGTGRFPLGMAQATRQWNEEEWAAAVERLAARGWAAADGALTDEGRAAREEIEAHTDRLCAPAWDVVGPDAARRLQALITPLHEAMAAAGTYAMLA